MSEATTGTRRDGAAAARAARAHAAPAGPVLDVVVVGSASRDITADDPRGWRLGGAVTYGALTLAHLGLTTGALIGVDDAAATADELQLLSRAGADVRLARLVRGPVFENVETPGGRVQTTLEPGEPLLSGALSGAFRTAPSWLFATVAGELPEAWADVPPADALVALSWQGLLRELPHGGPTRRRPPAPHRLLSRADIVGVSRDDLARGTQPEELMTLLKRGATLLVTDGARGGWRLVAGANGVERRHYLAVTADAEVDATGAGDVFLATYLAAHAGAALEGIGRRATALRLAAAAASLTVERPGLLGVPTRPDLAQRLRSPGRRQDDAAAGRPAGGPTAAD